MKDTHQNSDQYCKELLKNSHPQELKIWIHQGNNYLGDELSHNQSILLADKIYAMGAVNVFAVEIEEADDGLENTGQLVIRLPHDKVSRESILELASNIVEKQGFEAYSDVGQEYIFVMLD